MEWFMVAASTLCAALFYYSTKCNAVIVGCTYGTSMCALGLLRAYVSYARRPRLCNVRCWS